MATKYFDYSAYDAKGVCVTGLCAAPSMFEALSFELASSPGTTSSGSSLQSLLTLSRRVSIDSADLFTACINRTAAKDLALDVLTSYDCKLGARLAPVLRYQAVNAHVVRYAQYCVNNANNAVELWEDSSLACDSITLSALPPPSFSTPPDQQPYAIHTAGGSEWFVVTGLGSAPTGFERMTFEIAVTPGKVESSGVLRRSPMTLSRRVGTGSADAFNAYSAHGVVPKVVVFRLPAPAVTPGEAVSPVPTSTLTNTLVTRYSHYGASASGLADTQSHLLWEEVSIDYEQISLSIAQPPATSPGRPS